MGEQLTPRQIVHELDRFIVGQDEAKKAVAIALRNRYRRSRVNESLRDEIIPKNILMIGPTGVGKTEIARRLAKLVNAPFIKVEATKFTEVGYVGRDVESIIRDLAEKVDMNDWTNLASCRFVSALEAGFSLSGQIRRICRNRGIVPDIINYYNRADTVLLAVNSGVGISILPSTLIAFYNWPNVVAFPIEGSDALVSSVVAWNRSGGNPEVARFLAVSPLTELKKAR